MMDLPSNTDPAVGTAQDECYLEATALYGPALERLARGYESDQSRRQDLLRDIHVALWRSLVIFDGRCSLRTWVYRVAHHTATKHIMANRRVRLHEMHTLVVGLSPASIAAEIHRIKMFLAAVFQERASHE
jgi:DNA-directed RNA polymerase specialized sigma24 family protein